MVVVGKEARVDCLQLRPGRRLGIVVVRHPSHDVEVRLVVILPRLAALDLDVTDTERRIDEPCLLRLENAPAIADKHFGRAMGFDRGPQHDEVGRQVLPRRDRGGEQRPAEVLQDGDHVGRFAGPEGMILDVADIDRPELVPAPRRKRHCPWLARSRRRWQGGAEVY